MDSFPSLKNVQMEVRDFGTYMSIYRQSYSLLEELRVLKEQLLCYMHLVCDACQCDICYIQYILNIYILYLLHISRTCGKKAPDHKLGGRYRKPLSRHICSLRNWLVQDLYRRYTQSPFFLTSRLPWYSLISLESSRKYCEGHLRLKWIHSTTLQKYFIYIFLCLTMYVSTLARTSVNTVLPTEQRVNGAWRYTSATSCYLLKGTSKTTIQLIAMIADSVYLL